MLGWITLAAALAALPLGWLAYRSQRGKKRIEYIVLSSTRLLSGVHVTDLHVTLGERPVKDPVITLMRIANTGDVAIGPEDFHSDLSIDFGPGSEVLSVIVTKQRPSDLSPDTAIDTSRALIKPLLLNPAELLELQVVSTAKGSDLKLTGRIAGATILRRSGLPYPPGSGSEGEMLGFDKFVQYGLGVFVVVMLAMGLSAMPLTFGGVKGPILVVDVALFCLLAVTVYIFNIRRLVRQRRLWRP